MNGKPFRGFESHPLRLIHRRDSKATRALPVGEERSGSEGARLRRRSDSDGGEGIPPSPFPLRVVGVAFMRPDLATGSDKSEPLHLALLRKGIV